MAMEYYTVDRGFIERLFKTGNDSDWRAAKTIEEMQAIIKRQNDVIRDCYHMINKLPNVASKSYYIDFDDHNTWQAAVDRFNVAFNEAIENKVFEYSWGTFKTVEAKK